LRFLLANTSDFDPAKDALPVAEWLEIDRYALAMTREMANACIADYAKFEFHLVAQRIQNFCSEDLGGFWLDILKDRLYTTRAASRAHRRRGRPAAPRLPRRGPALRPHHVAGDAREGRGRRAADRSDAERARQVRALLALPRRRRFRPRPRDPLRALRGHARRARRGA